MLSYRTAFTSLLLLGAGLLSCRKPQPYIQATVAVLPSTLTLSCEGTRRFVPQVSAGGTRPVVWKVVEPSGGTIDANGAYIAPKAPGLFTIVASESGPQHAQGLARVRVVPKPDGTIRVPEFIRVGSKGVKAEVLSQEGASYQWSITGGTIVSPMDGPFVLFDAAMTKHVLLKCRVTNAAGDSLNSSLDVETYPEPQVSIRPDHVVVSTDEAFKFGYEVSGRLDAPLRWRVVEEGGGTIDQFGVYKSPSTPGSFQVEVLPSPGKPGIKLSVKVVARPQGRIELSEDLVEGVRSAKACVPVQVGMSYAWKVIGGSIVVGRNISCLQFSVDPGPTVTLICTLTNEAGASLELTRTLPVKPSGK